MPKASLTRYISDVRFPPIPAVSLFRHRLACVCHPKGFCICNARQIGEAKPIVRKASRKQEGRDLPSLGIVLGGSFEIRTHSPSFKAKMGTHPARGIGWPLENLTAVEAGELCKSRFHGLKRIVANFSFPPTTVIQ